MLTPPNASNFGTDDLTGGSSDFANFTKLKAAANLKINLVGTDLSVA